MSLKTYPRDANGKPLPDLGTEFFPVQIPVGTDAINLKLGVDCKGLYIYNEGPNDLTLTGLDAEGNPIAAAVIPLSDTAIVDNGDGTMNVTTLVNHGFTVLDNVVIQDRTADSVAGTYEIQLGSATDQLILLANWTVNLTLDEGTDNGDGTVTLLTDGDHHIAVGGFVTIAGRTDDAYAGTYTTAAGTATDELVITAVYVDESAGVTAGGTVVGVYDESAGVAAAGDATGIHKAVLVADSGLPMPIAREARSPLARVVSAGTSTIDIFSNR